METLILVAAFGLAWGSFLNVVIYRLPREMSLLHPPSTCPGCKKRIKPYDNIPLFSYLLLGGKCRFCRKRIPFSYFLVEALTPAAFIVLFLRGSRTVDLPFIASCLFTSALIALGFIDFHHKILPDLITLPGLALALIYSVFRPDMTFRQALVGAAIGAGFLLFVYGAYFLVRKKEGLGMGDVTMMLFVGAYLGWMGTVLTLILGSFAGAVIGAFFLLVRKKDLQFELPFGTFLAPAAFISLLWGEQIVRAYLGLFKR